MSLSAGVEEEGVNGCLGLECDMIGGKFGKRFKTGSKCGRRLNQIVCV